MARYVFLNLPTYGSINPTLAVVSELVARGQEVVYYVPERFRRVVEAAGAVTRGYRSVLDTVEPSAHVRAGGMPALMVSEGHYVVPQVLDRVAAERPDCMVFGTVYVPARIVSHALGVPAIALRPTYAANEHADWFTTMLTERTREFADAPEIIARVSKGLAELCRMYGVPPFDARGIVTHAERLNIVFIPRAFQLAGETFDERYVFVGPAIDTRPFPDDFPLAELGPEGPVLYISLGTIFNNRPDFFQTCFEAFGGQATRVVISLGRQVDPGALGAVPDNVVVARHVPQLEVLRRARVFVSHCGMNSTMESLYHGVPMVAAPQMPEQAITARRIAELGLGVDLGRAVTVESLRDAVARVAEDPAFRDRARWMQRVTREAGGQQLAADSMIRFVRDHAGSQRTPTP